MIRAEIRSGTTFIFHQKSHATLIAVLNDIQEVRILGDLLWLICKNGSNCFVNSIQKEGLLE